VLEEPLVKANEWVCVPEAGVGDEDKDPTVIVAEGAPVAPVIECVCVDAPPVLPEVESPRRK